MTPFSDFEVRIDYLRRFRENGDPENQLRFVTPWASLSDFDEATRARGARWLIARNICHLRQFTSCNVAAKTVSAFFRDLQ